MEDWPGSKVMASIANNRLEAAIFFNNSMSNGIFIEDGSRYHEFVDCLQDPYRNGEFENNYCAIAYHQDFTTSHHDRTKRSTDDNFGGMCGWNSPFIAKRLQEWLRVSPDSLSVDNVDLKHRRKRAANTATKVCSMYVQVDPTLWQTYMNDFKNNEDTARVAVTQLAADLVQGINEIYETTPFQSVDGSTGPFTGFLFQISKIRVYTKTEVCSSSNKIVKQLCNEYIDSDAFLKINSELDHGEFCLAYMLSHRQFSNGVMGLAWVGYPAGYMGGVCQKPTRTTAGTLSYNTGIITSNNQGKKVSKKSLMLTLAHEVGHNFGSPHDKGDTCSPKGTGGFYIMVRQIFR